MNVDRLLIERHRRGERITTADHVPALRSAEEIEAFAAEAKRQGTWSPEIARLCAEMRRAL